MELNELKALLEIPINSNTNDVLLQIQLDAAIQKAQTYCKRSFIGESGLVELPGDVKIAVKIFVEGMNTNEAIQSDSVSGGFSKTYREGGYDAAAKAYLKPYKRVRFL